MSAANKNPQPPGPSCTTLGRTNNGTDAAYREPVPAYEFRCRQCGDTFVLNRPMSQSSDAALCPSGHQDTVRLLNVAAVGGGKVGGGHGSVPSAPTSGGGCCGGGCCG